MRFLFVVLFVGTMAHASDWQGTWQWGPDKDQNGDEYSGRLRVRNCDATSCDFDVFNDIRTFTCSMTGRFKIDGMKATFRDGTCVLTFTRETKKEKPEIIVGAEGCQENCGMSAYFDGNFLRTSDKWLEVAGFDCAKAATAVENAICGSEKLARIDRLLGVTFRQLKKKTKKPAQAALAQEQRAWVEKRDKDCPTAEEACLVKVYDLRKADLETRLKH